MKAQSFENNPKNDINLSFWKEENPWEDKCVEQFFAERVVSEGPHPAASREMVNHVALSRLFQLLEYGRSTLKGIFSDKEILLMCHSNAQPWWKENLWGDKTWTISESVFYEYIDEKKCTPEIKLMFEKIQALDKFQRFVLADTLECAWRNGKTSTDYISSATQ